MTRETKVGLLVGMGVILLIGIIISDHLAVVQQQDPAELTGFANRAQESIAPLVDPRQVEQIAADPIKPLAREQSVMQRMQPLPTPQELEAPPWQPIPEEAVAPSPLAELPRAYKLAEPPSPPAYDNPQIQRAQAPQTPEAQPQIPSLTLSHETQPQQAAALQAERAATTAPLPGEQLAMATGPQIPTPVPAPVNTQPAKPAGTEIIHYVASGETLYEIAKKYYGSGDYWRMIAEHNPGKVRPGGEVNQGVRLVVPNRAGLAALSDDFVPVDEATARRMGVAPRTSRGAVTTIEVKEGDTLSKLAAEHLGSGSKWKLLMEANKDQIASPEQLRVGMKLKIPAAAGTQAPAAANANPNFGLVRVARPEPRKEEKPQAQGKTYTVVSGDNLHAIAAKTLGDGNRWREIFEANKDKLDSPDSVVIGQKLKIPG